MSKDPPLPETFSCKYLCVGEWNGCLKPPPIWLACTFNASCILGSRFFFFRIGFLIAPPICLACAYKASSILGSFFFFFRIGLTIAPPSSSNFTFFFCVAVASSAQLLHLQRPYGTFFLQRPLLENMSYPSICQLRTFS